MHKRCGRVLGTYVSMEALLKADSEGLVDSLNFGLQILGIQNLCHRDLVLQVANQPVVGGGTDGTSVNIHSRAKWNERKVAKRTCLAFLDMVLCTQVRASM